MPELDNFGQAMQDLDMTPQEQNLYRMHLANLWGDGGVDNPDGSRSTLYASVTEHDGKYYNVPTVWNGKRETKQYTRPSDGQIFDVPNDTALAKIDAAGWNNFPSSDDPNALVDRYDKLHNYMERDTGSYFAMAPDYGSRVPVTSIDPQM